MSGNTQIKISKTQLKRSTKKELHKILANYIEKGLQQQMYKKALILLSSSRFLLCYFTQFSILKNFEQTVYPERRLDDYTYIDLIIKSTNLLKMLIKVENINKSFNKDMFPP